MCSNLYLIIKYIPNALGYTITRIKRFCLFIFLVFTQISNAQELSFENIQLKDFPSTETHKILQDGEGFIWIATDAGICKYDGSNLTTYTVKDGIPENVVLKMVLDSKNRVWGCTLSGYFFYYEKGHFVSIAANPNLKKMLKDYFQGAFFIGEKDTLF